jgi:hypothetical protein
LRGCQSKIARSVPAAEKIHIKSRVGHAGPSPESSKDLVMLPLSFQMLRPLVHALSLIFRLSGNSAHSIARCCALDVRNIPLE